MQEAIRDKRIFRNFARDNDKRQTSQGVCRPVSLEVSLKMCNFAAQIQKSRKCV